MKDPRVLFGSIIALILLGLYAFSLIEAIKLALLEIAPGAPNPELNPGLSHTLATVGGLVSALVIAELAISKPGEAPAARVLAPSNPNAPPPTPTTERTFSVISLLYVLAWILLGLVAYVVGAMLHPGKVQALTDFGQAWLGLAVAAAYAYFGINR